VSQRRLRLSDQVLASALREQVVDAATDVKTAAIGPKGRIRVMRRRGWVLTAFEAATWRGPSYPWGMTAAPAAPVTSPRRRWAASLLFLVLWLGFVAWLVNRPRAPYVPSYSKQDHLKALAELEAAGSPFERYYALDQAAMTSLYHGTLAEARSLANELLGLSATLQRNWNYGNAVHAGHIVLGVVALREGRRAEAVAHLLDAGRTPGSPQLDSFGPCMLLAKELFENGERAAILEYFTLCERFWKMHRGRLDAWAAAVRADRMPDFGIDLL
jgi:hypothetical protein